jgi:mannose-6-phosphate isomerase-like protein (cupin superfamily)
MAERYLGDLEDAAEDNRDFRRVIWTGEHLQLVLMTLEPGEEIGDEAHPATDQFFRVESGKGELVVNGLANAIDDDSAIVVPAGARHNVRNTGRKPLRLWTLYAPPQHPAGTVQHTRAEAELAHAQVGGR